MHDKINKNKQRQYELYVFTAWPLKHQGAWSFLGAGNRYLGFYELNIPKHK